MRTIHKFPLTVPIPPGDATIAFDIRTPVLSRLLHAGLDPQGDLCLWYMVDTDYDSLHTVRHVKIYGTGRECNEPVEDYFATVLQGEFVWHIFIKQ